MMSTGTAAIDAAVARVAAELGDVTSRTAMRGRCYDASRKLAAALDGAAILDEDGELEATVEAWEVQLWNAPARLANDEMAAGHYVTAIKAGSARWVIDLTAAQFGAAGPLVGEGRPSWDTLGVE